LDLNVSVQRSAHTTYVLLALCVLSSNKDSVSTSAPRTRRVRTHINVYVYTRL
jgi:hypothetical protein